jgi:glycine/D-amino acid oxidase-like deaminating enzyme
VVDTNLADLIKMYGSTRARKVWTSGLEAIDLVEKIMEEENIDCDFTRVSNYLFATKEAEAENLKKEHHSAEKLGFKTLLHDKEALPFKNFGSLEIENQAKFHPLRFLTGLRQAAEKHGAVFYENTEAKTVTGNKRVVVKTKSGKVSADYCIVTTYKPFHKPKELFAHTGMYVSYVLEASIPAGVIKEGLYEDEKNPYHYFRIDRGEGNHDRIILGGEDHREEIPISKDKNFRALEDYLAKLLPESKYEIKRRWSGPILETIDGLPYIGRYSKKHKNTLVAAGFSGNGMTYSAVAAQILSDIILRADNPYVGLYSASRKAKLYSFMLKGRDFASEFFGGFIRNFFR